MFRTSRFILNNTIYVTILLVIVLFVLYSLLFFVYDPNLQRDDEALAEKLKIGPLEALLNGSGINNIPQLNLISTNTAITTANNCGKGPVNIGASGDDSDCIKVCANSSAKAVQVNEGEEYYYGSNALTPGVQCIIGPRPECDTKTTIVLMTVNSVICRPRFPRVIGGQIGTKVIACNNRLIQDPKNVLWDYKYNVRFDPMTTTILDEDEILPDGTYRLRCKFLGSDERGNLYMEHPTDRFHPIRNYCASLIYRAHPDVKTEFIDHGNDYRCDCGNYADTRAKNLVIGDTHTQCSPISANVSETGQEVNTVEIPYNCFTLFSPITSVPNMPPCPNDQFTREGLQMSSIKVTYTENQNVILEHPLYDKMSRSGVTTEPADY